MVLTVKLATLRHSDAIIGAWLTEMRAPIMPSDVAEWSEGNKRTKVHKGHKEGGFMGGARGSGRNRDFLGRRTSVIVNLAGA